MLESFRIESGGREQRQLELNVDIKLTQTESGEALIYTIRFRKNFKGGLKQSSVKPNVIKAFSNNSDENECIVRVYKLYSEKMPPNGKCKAFYLQPRLNYSDDEWYSDSPMGYNSLSNILKSTTDAAGLEDHFTNHSFSTQTIE